MFDPILYQSSHINNFGGRIPRDKLSFCIQTLAELVATVSTTTMAEQEKVDVQNHNCPHVVASKMTPGFTELDLHMARMACDQFTFTPIKVKN